MCYILSFIIYFVNKKNTFFLKRRKMPFKGECVAQKRKNNIFRKIYIYFADIFQIKGKRCDVYMHLGYKCLTNSNEY